MINLNPILTPLERKVHTMLISNPCKVITYEDFQQAGIPFKSGIGGRANLAILIHNIRCKFPELPIHSVYKRGYIYEPRTTL